MKKCLNPKCDQHNPQDVSQFYKDTRFKDGLRSRCKSCMAKAASEWSQKNPEKIKESGKLWKSKNRKKVKQIQENWHKNNPLRGKANYLVQYWPKLTASQALDAYQALVESQGNKCAICNCAETRKDSRSKKIKDLAVDHDHTTGLVRGLLCGACNTAIGLLRDDPDLTQSATNYLKRT